MKPTLPRPRGALSNALLDRLRIGQPIPTDLRAPPNSGPTDPLTDDDLHLALWCCYELHYHGFDQVDERLEWDPAILAFRAEMESSFEGALRAEHQAAAVPADPALALRVIADWAGPPLASTVEADGARWQLAELAVHRSIYQLKEADPHTWVIPRLTGPARSALIEIQADEYGGGRPGEAHGELFAAAMAELGLSPAFGAYVDEVPGVTLATDNLVSMFGLNRRLRGALIGHLALFEMCSVVPMTRYLTAARRVGGLQALERFYRVHIEVDAHHARLALDHMVAHLAEQEPDLAADITFGAAALSRAEARFARHVLRTWKEGRSSLRAMPVTSTDDTSAVPASSSDRPRPRPGAGPAAADRVLA
ncbi:MAG: iron-containing redox enzyme family protein [Acidimicrobiales bacterium]